MDNLQSQRLYWFGARSILLDRRPGGGVLTIRGSSSRTPVHLVLPPLSAEQGLDSIADDIDAIHVSDEGGNLVAVGRKIHEDNEQWLAKTILLDDDRNFIRAALVMVDHVTERRRAWHGGPDPVGLDVMGANDPAFTMPEKVDLLHKVWTFIQGEKSFYTSSDRLMYDIFLDDWRSLIIRDRTSLATLSI